MVVVGLTGGIGAGKSTFARLLAERGAHVIDVDAVGREVIAPGGPAAGAVQARFGTLDRRELAGIVFREPAARHDLEAVSWPAIDAELARRVAAQQPDAVVVLDMAVLAQGDLGKGLYGPVVTVEADEKQRVRRLVERGMTEADARARMRSQVAEQVRRDLADVVVDNDDDLATLAAAADALWATLVSGTGAATSTDYAVPRFCSRCARPVTGALRHGERAWSCACGHVQFLRPTVGVAVVVVEEGCILLVRRAYGAKAGQWCIPCGHVGWDEDVREAAVRELAEETGVVAELGPVLNVHTNRWRPDRQTVGVWFQGRRVSGEVRAADDADDARFVPLAAIDVELAFPTDELVIEQVRQSASGSLPDDLT